MRKRKVRSAESNLYRTHVVYKKRIPLFTMYLEIKNREGHHNLTSTLFRYLLVISEELFCVIYLIQTLVRVWGSGE